jgi:hypothetical protein
MLLLELDRSSQVCGMIAGTARCTRLISGVSIDSTDSLCFSLLIREDGWPFLTESQDLRDASVKRKIAIHLTTSLIRFPASYCIDSESFVDKFGHVRMFITDCSEIEDRMLD